MKRLLALWHAACLSEQCLTHGAPAFAGARANIADQCLLLWHQFSIAKGSIQPLISVLLRWTRWGDGWISWECHLTAASLVQGAGHEKRSGNALLKNIGKVSGVLASWGAAAE